MAIATVAYALSPIDLIPDFIPVLGYLDDLILVPLAIVLTVRQIPGVLMATLREDASRRLSQRLPGNRLAALLILLFWMGIGIILIRMSLAPDLGT